jgi:hypothetical protein
MKWIGRIFISLMAFIKGLIKGRGDAEIIDIVTIFVTAMPLT